MRKHARNVSSFWFSVTVTMCAILLFLGATRPIGANGNSEAKDDHVTVDMASAWMAQSALEKGEIVDALLLAYSWHREVPDSWMPFDFIGDVYYCLSEFEAAKLNYKLALVAANASGDSIAILELKIHSIEGKAGAIEKISRITLCPESRKPVFEQN